MFTKVITHRSPKHFDDFLALCYLSSVFDGNIEIIEVHPQDDKELIEDALQDENIFVVDVGQVYDPLKNNFDHHFDKDVECSFVLLVKKFEGDNSPLIQNNITGYIDISDRLGPKEAQKRFNISFSDDLADTIRVILDNIDPVMEGKKVMEVLKTCVTENKDFASFVYELYRVFEQKLQPIKQFMIEEREKEMMEIFKKIEVFSTAGHGILIIPVDPKNFMAKIIRGVEEELKFSVSIVISPNQMNKNHLSITRNSYNEKALREVDLSILKERLEKAGINSVFFHPNGFLLVVDCGFDKIGVILKEINTMLTSHIRKDNSLDGKYAFRKLLLKKDFPNKDNDKKPKP